MCEEYNGWTNKATWLLYTWVTGEEESCKRWEAMAKEYNTFELAELLEEETRETSWDVLEGSGLYRDPLTYVLPLIDYGAVAAGLKKN